MYTQQMQRDQAETIESIIYSFYSNFISGIKRSRNDPFVVGQIAASLIEQLSGFLFDEPPNARLERFIQTYLQPYKELDLYTVLRNSQDRRLTDKLGMILVGVPASLKPNGYVGPDPGKVIDAFTQDLQDAVNMAACHLRDNKQKWPHAFSWLRTNPVYKDFRFTLYTSDERTTLQNYYTPLLEPHMIFMTESRWGWGFNYGDGGHFIVLLIDNVGGRNETSRVPLEIFIQLLGLKWPEQVLAE